MTPQELSEATNEARRWLVGGTVLSVGDFMVRFDDEAGPLLHVAENGSHLAGREAHTVVDTSVTPGGALELRWDDGLASIIEPHPSLEGWDVWADGMTRLVCVPGGEVLKFVPVDPNEPVPEWLRELMDGA